MRLSRADLQYLKWSLLAFAASLSSVISAVSLSDSYLARTILRQAEAQQRIEAARNELSITQDDLNNIATYASEYESLLERKIIADEQRLDWMEGIDIQSQRHHLINLKYTLAPQQIYPSDSASNIESMNIHFSSIDLQTELLHEMQLMDFFSALRSEKKGYFLINRCELERTGTNVEIAAITDTRLSANCSGGWITMQHRSAQ